MTAIEYYLYTISLTISLLYSVLEKRVLYMLHRVLYSTAKDLLCNKKNDDNDKKEPLWHKGYL